MRRDVTTLHGDGERSEEGRIERRVVALTVLSHPMPARVGERAVLRALADGAAIELSRHAPGFSSPSAVWDREGLDDPFLSRRPWRLGPAADGGLALARAGSSTEVRVDGVPVAEAIELSSPRLEAGVVLELAGRIALWLHRLGDPPPPAAPRGDALVGEGEALRPLRQSLERVSRVDVPVLVRGETGTGKELVASALHARSRRRGRPFVAVNLAALPSTLAAAELFGHAKGAFTGAAQARPGLFRAADGGTLFLDEVGEASEEVQAMLLRVLETRRVMAVGSQTESPVDVRLVAATDAPLEQQAERGEFRAPLLHRLAAYEIWLPPLRERREDIGRLVLHFARQVEDDMGRGGWLEAREPSGPPWLPSALMARLARYHWPGNVRQLRNVVSQLMIDAQGQDGLRAGPRLSRLLHDESVDPRRRGPEDGRRGRRGDGEGDGAVGEAVERRPRHPGDVTPAELYAAMREERFEPAAAAKRLGIRRPSIYNLIREHPELRVVEDLDADEIRRALDEAGGVAREAARRLEVSARALSRRVGRDGLRAGLSDG